MLSSLSPDYRLPSLPEGFALDWQDVPSEELPKHATFVSLSDARAELKPWGPRGLEVHLSAGVYSYEGVSGGMRGDIQVSIYGRGFLQKHLATRNHNLAASRYVWVCHWGPRLTVDNMKAKLESEVLESLEWARIERERAVKAEARRARRNREKYGRA